MTGEKIHTLAASIHWPLSLQLLRADNRRFWERSGNAFFRPCLASQNLKSRRSVAAHGGCGQRSALQQWPRREFLICSFVLPLFSLLF